MSMLEEALGEAAKTGWRMPAGKGVLLSSFTVENEDIANLIEKYPALAAALKLLEACKACDNMLMNCVNVLGQLRAAIAEAEPKKEG